MALGLEQHYVEKHPAAITALAFHEDKVLMSGSVDGRVNLCDLETAGTTNKIFKAQNCMDRKIPVAQVIASEFGIGAALDIEGNCRFYDLVRLRKICKISSAPHASGSSTSAGSKWRMLPKPTLASTPDSLLGIV
jgi:WD40 repeat protein